MQLWLFENLSLCVLFDLFYVMYAEGKQTKLDLHQDDSLWSFNVLLNSELEFRGIQPYRIALLPYVVHALIFLRVYPCVNERSQCITCGILAVLARNVASL